jgi:hypothetical protein
LINQTRLIQAIVNAIHVGGISRNSGLIRGECLTFDYFTRVNDNSQERIPAQLTQLEYVLL